MTRKQFLNDLYLRLTPLGPEQAEQHLTYYAEMLADRMEEGMSEDEAVASMEDVETIARRILEEEGLPEKPQPVAPPSYPDASRIPGGGGTRAYKPPKKWNRRRIVGAALWGLAIVAIVGAVAGVANNHRAEHTVAAEWSETPSMDLVDSTEAVMQDSPYSTFEGGTWEIQPDQVQHVVIQGSNGGVRVEESGTGTVQFYVEDTRRSANALNYQLSDGVLELWNNGRNEDLVLLVPDGLLNGLTVHTVSAGVTLSGVGCGYLDIGTTSGDVAIYGSLYAETISVESTSGDIALYDLQANNITVKNTSGEVDFSGVEAMNCQVNTISGDMYLDIGGAAELYANSTSGDLDLAVWEGAPDYISVITKSGEVDMDLPEDLDFTLVYNTVSGDLESDIPLVRSGNTYTHSVAGGTGCSIEVQTTNGDLELGVY